MPVTHDTGARAAPAVRESWASRVGFVLAAAGFAIGLGNIWRFPYMTGMNGGGAFLLVYLLLALVVGIPLFAAEISLGRRSQLTPIAGMRRLTGGRGSPWNLIGWFGVAAAFLIMSYYQVIMGWVLAYLVKTASGAFVSATPGQVEAGFAGFIADPWAVLPYVVAIIALLGLVVTRGLRDGVERVSKWLMPALFVCLLLLALGSLMLPGAAAGLRWYLAPDFSKLDASVVLAALGQVFYSIGVGMAGAFVYGSYLHPEDSDIPGGVMQIVAFDTLAAFVAGLVIFPAVFAMGLGPDAGPGLLFVTMTNVFAALPLGHLAGGVFFFLVLIAGLTSGVALVEALAASLIDSFGLRRSVAVWALLAATFLAGVPSLLAFGPWTDVRAFGMDAFTLMDFVSGNVLLPLGGLLIACYTAFAWGFDAFQGETNRGAGRVRITGIWRPLVRLVIPAAVALVLLSSLGLFTSP